jgi:hypothetical protein
MFLGFWLKPSLRDLAFSIALPTQTLGEDPGPPFEVGSKFLPALTTFSVLEDPERRKRRRAQSNSSCGCEQVVLGVAETHFMRYERRHGGEKNTTGGRG